MAGWRRNPSVAGGIAGAAATAVMSAWMLLAGRFGWQGEQPPERIVESALDEVGLERSEGQENALASVAHLGFGMTMGVVYAQLLRRLRVRIPPPAAGALFGLAVWSGNYQTWIPWTGILPPPRHDRPGRPASMIVAHLIFGAVLGALVGHRADPVPAAAAEDRLGARGRQAAPRQPW